MSYLTIVTVLQTEQTARSALPVAIELAKTQGAHLVGLHASPASPIYPALGYELPGVVYEEARRQAQALAGKLEALFIAAVSSEADIQSEWREVSSSRIDVSDAVLDHARGADLAVVAQINPDAPGSADTELAGSLILEAGRPVLVVPYARSVSTVGTNVMIAWNGSRESARAVFDALPLLKGAKEVRLFGVNRDQGSEAKPQLPGTELATNLARHGVNLTVENAAGVGGNIADALLSRIADRGSDLLVMGGYGHSRARERFFGGVTRTILQSMTVPVLFSN